jgi:hypothetical protein
MPIALLLLLAIGNSLTFPDISRWNIIHTGVTRARVESQAICLVHIDFQSPLAKFESYSSIKNVTVFYKVNKINSSECDTLLKLMSEGQLSNSLILEMYQNKAWLALAETPQERSFDFSIDIFEKKSGQWLFMVSVPAGKEINFLESKYGYEELPSDYIK